MTSKTIHPGKGRLLLREARGLSAKWPPVVDANLNCFRHWTAVPKAL